MNIWLIKIKIEYSKRIIQSRLLSNHNKHFQNFCQVLAEQTYARDRESYENRV